jgi:alpha-glucosidase
VAAQDGDPASTLELYRAALRIRRQHPGLSGDAFAWMDEDEGSGILHFERGDGFRCLVNLDADPVPLPEGARLLVRSDGPAIHDPAARHVPAETAAWYIA